MLEVIRGSCDAVYRRVIGQALVLWNNSCHYLSRYLESWLVGRLVGRLVGLGFVSLQIETLTDRSQDVEIAFHARVVASAGMHPGSGRPVGGPECG